MGRDGQDTERGGGKTGELADDTNQHSTLFFLWYMTH